jgi:flagellar protein FliS
LDHDAYRSYHAVNLDAQIARASPVQLVLMLMDGLLEEMARARAHIEQRRYEQKAISLNRCVDMLYGLSSSLDTDAGSDVVANLARLYDYCVARLDAAGLTLDASIVDEVASVLGTIRRGWTHVQDSGFQGARA